MWRKKSARPTEVDAPRVVQQHPRVPRVREQDRPLSEGWEATSDSGSNAVFLRHGWRQIILPFKVDLGGGGNQVSGIKGQVNLELDEKPRCPGNPCLKPRPRLVPIPTRTGAPTPAAQWAQLRGDMFPTCGPCWQCTCDRGRVCNQRSPQHRGAQYLSVLWLVVLLQNTCKWQAHQNQWKPTSCTSQWGSYWQTRPTGPRMPQADPDSRSDPIPFHHENTWTKSVHRPPDRPEEHHKRRQGKIHEKSFKILPQMQLNLRR